MMAADKPGHPGLETVELLNSIYPVSRETIGRLAIYESLLRQWQVKTNLVANGTLDDFWTRHVADSLQLLKIRPQARYWTDLGSGGGFPGMVLAIVLGTELGAAGSKVRMVESIRKKCAFLAQVALKAGVSPEINAMRIEDAGHVMDQAEVITARALASLDKLLKFTEGKVTGDRIALFHKGRDYAAEVEKCHGQWRFDLLVHPSILDPESVILEVSNVRRKPGESG